ncbi:hypothetical protein M2212_002911 [Bradyrhizobium elkanii]|nr:hypothetical protein [Bradyrhizobium elkanii]
MPMASFELDMILLVYVRAVPIASVELDITEWMELRSVHFVSVADSCLGSHSLDAAKFRKTEVCAEAAYHTVSHTHDNLA